MELKLQIKDNMIEQIDALAEDLHISREDLLERLMDLPGEELSLMLRRPHTPLIDGESFELKTIGIIGCTGTARGLAKLMAVRGVSVIMVGEDEEKVLQAMDLMDHNLDWMIYKWELTKTEKKVIIQYIETSTKIRDLREVDMVFDTYRGCSSEREIIYSKIMKYVPSDRIIAVDDSSCLVSDLAKRINNPERLIGFHMAYPTSRRKLVEIMRGRKTSDATYRKMVRLAKFLDKEIIEVLECAGGISTRVMIPFVSEAIRLWTEGIASANEIDRALKLSMNLPQGPLEYADAIGLDVLLETMDSLWKIYGMQQFRPPARLRHLVRMGMLGKKTGSGIHSYEDSKLGVSL